MASEPPIGPLGGDFTDESDEDGSEYDYPTGGRGGGGGGGGGSMKGLRSSNGMSLYPLKYTVKRFLQADLTFFFSFLCIL